MGKIIPPLTPEVLVPRIGEYLVQKGWISPDDLHGALEIQHDSEQNQPYPPLLGQILIEQGKISRADLDTAITEQIILLRQALQNANQTLEQRVRDRTIQLEDVLKKLSDANQVKNNFIANISHELRTPLTHIKGYLDLVICEDLGALTSEQTDALRITLRAASRLEHLVEDLILFSDSQITGLSLDITIFSIYALGQWLVKQLHPKAQEKKIMLEFVSNAQISEATGDEEKYGWVIAHLLENAIKFTPAGGSVKLQYMQLDEEILVSVIDTGIGIPEDRIGEIYEPFHQLDGSSTRRYGGTGLGLSLAKQIVEAHGSVLNVTSQTGKGTRFDFCIKSNTLPVSKTNRIAGKKEG